MRTCNRMSKAMPSHTHTHAHTHTQLFPAASKSRCRVPPCPHTCRHITEPNTHTHAYTHTHTILWKGVGVSRQPRVCERCPWPLGRGRLLQNTSTARHMSSGGEERCLEDQQAARAHTHTQETEGIKAMKPTWIFADLLRLPFFPFALFFPRFFFPAVDFLGILVALAYPKDHVQHTHASTSTHPLSHPHCTQRNKQGEAKEAKKKRSEASKSKVPLLACVCFVCLFSCLFRLGCR